MMWLFAAVPVLLLAVWIFLFAPAFKKPDETPFRGWLFAHRGLHCAEAGVPENSMAGFAKAVENGFGIELDVQLTADGIAVVHHDGSLKRVCGVDRLIREMTFEELQEIRLPDGSRIPAFAEVLELVNGQVPLVVEIKKESGPVRTAEVAWEHLKEYKGVFCMESFHPLAVRYFRKHAPHVLRGQLSTGKAGGSLSPATSFLLSHLWVNFLGRPHFISYDEANDSIAERWLAVKVFGAIPVAWTIRSREQQERASAKGYRYMIFEQYVPEKGEDYPGKM